MDDSSDSSIISNLKQNFAEKCRSIKVDESSDSSCGIPNLKQNFAEKCIFITGVTGFVGKVLLEKLLRSCADISKVFVLIRSNEKYSAEQRLNKLLQSSVFDRVKEECPCAIAKVEALDGNVTEKDLKLKPQDLVRLYTEVHFVFHCAACVRFENDERDTLKINLFGVKNVMTVCQRMPKLMAVVHVSTAYSFCNKEVIDEVIYDEEFNLDELEEAVRSLDSTRLKKYCDRISQSRPSLYQYSKALAEVYIKRCCKNLPIIIVRPSIITASMEEPQKGWIDNYNGPSGFIALSIKGILKTLLVKPGIKADWVPVDIVANTLILAAHYMVMERMHNDAILKPLSNPSGVIVLNCVSPPGNSITWSKVVEICIPLLYKYPSLDLCRLPGGYVTEWPALYRLLTYIYHYFPAVIMDLAMMLLWKEPRFVSNYIRIHKVLNFLQLYTMNEFFFMSLNMVRLNEIFYEEREIFQIDMNYLHWEQYLTDYVKGVRFFFLKESEDTLPQARIKLNRLQKVFLVSKIVSLGLFLAILVKQKQKINMASNVSWRFTKDFLKSSSKFIAVNVLKF